MSSTQSRRSFVKAIGAGAIVPAFSKSLHLQDKPIPGFEKVAADSKTSEGWKPISDRKIRVGLVG